MFDAKMKTYTQRKAYTGFLNNLKGKGYEYLQKSIYTRFSATGINANAERKKINKIVPDSVSVRMLIMPFSLFDETYDINCEKKNFIAKEHIICI